MCACVCVCPPRCVECVAVCVYVRAFTCSEYNKARRISDTFGTNTAEQNGEDVHEF